MAREYKKDKRYEVTQRFASWAHFEVGHVIQLEFWDGEYCFEDYEPTHDASYLIERICNDAEVSVREL